jgi:serine/threonine protein kinase
MYDASEIGLDWKGSLYSLSLVSQSKCAFATIDGSLKQHTGEHRCNLRIENVIADSTMGKLAWAKRRLAVGQSFTDYLVKRPISQQHAKQEAVIQWLAHKILSQYELGIHCPNVLDVFTISKSIWFSMTPVYNAPILDVYLKSLPTWGSPHQENGLVLLKIISQIAMSCYLLEKEIGFNHRDLKPDNILVKNDRITSHVLRRGNVEIYVAPSPTAILVDFGFSCLGPGTLPWIQSGDGILSPLDSCPKVGRDIFMLLVFLLWRKDVRKSLTEDHINFFKSSLHLTTERWSQMFHIGRDPIDWIYMLITEQGFQCPALDPWIWLQSCSVKYPEVVLVNISRSV